MAKAGYWLLATTDHESLIFTAGLKDLHMKSFKSAYILFKVVFMIDSFTICPGTTKTSYFSVSDGDWQFIFLKGYYQIILWHLSMLYQV